MSEMSLLEVRVIVYSFLFLGILLTFGVLRLFNAVVNFTRIGYKLRETISLLSNQIAASDRQSKQLSGLLSSNVNILSNSLRVLKTTISNYYDRISEQNKNSNG